MTQFASYPSLIDKVVVITGGAAGIGANLVSEFSAQNAKVAFIDVDEAEAAHLQEILHGKTKHAPRFYKTDLCDLKHLQKTLHAIRGELGMVNVLVNNAARDDRHSIESVTPESWRSCLSINLDHYFFASQMVLPDMRIMGAGSIINMSSITWIAGFGNMPGYVTANAGIMGLTRSVARDVGDFGIRVNAIVPGWVMTDRQRKLWASEEATRKWSERCCLKSTLLPQDISRLALFLAADDSQMISSQCYAVDAGYV